MSAILSPKTGCLASDANQSAWVPGPWSMNMNFRKSRPRPLEQRRTSGGTVAEPALFKRPQSPNNFELTLSTIRAAG